MYKDFNCACLEVVGITSSAMCSDVFGYVGYNNSAATGFCRNISRYDETIR